MSDLSDKSKVHDLYACLTPQCGVMTFIQMEECPVCHQPGSVIRRSDIFEHGQPPDPSRFSAIEPGESG